MQQNYAYAGVEVIAGAIKYFHSGQVVAAYHDFNNVNTSLRC
jgi:hypothetical protein